MDTNTEQLISYLKITSDFCSQRKRSGYNYSCIEDFVLVNGKSFNSQPLKKDCEAGMPKACFRNAFLLAKSNKNLTYVEGFAHCQIPIHHAWCVDEEGNVIDNTWCKRNNLSQGLAYFGVQFFDESILDSHKGGSILDNWEKNWPLLKVDRPFNQGGGNMHHEEFYQQMAQKFNTSIEEIKRIYCTYKDKELRHKLQALYLKNVVNKKPHQQPKHHKQRFKQQPDHLFPKRNALHNLFRLCFGHDSCKESHTWLFKKTGKRHVSDLNENELIRAIEGARILSMSRSLRNKARDMHSY